MATISRHPTNYSTHHKSPPVIMPSKQPTYNFPISRAMSPPDLSEISSYSGGRSTGGSYSVSSGHSYAPSHTSSEYDSYSSHRGGVDVVDMLSQRMNDAFDPITMDRALVSQVQTSGQLNAKQRELQELQAMAQRRLKTARVNFAEGVEAARETRRDIDYISKKTSAMKSKAEKKHPEAYAKASRSRH